MGKCSSSRYTQMCGPVYTYLCFIWIMWMGVIWTWSRTICQYVNIPPRLQGLHSPNMLVPVMTTQDTQSVTWSSITIERMRIFHRRGDMAPTMVWLGHLWWSMPRFCGWGNLPNYLGVLKALSEWHLISSLTFYSLAFFVVMFKWIGGHVGWAFLFSVGEVYGENLHQKLKDSINHTLAQQCFETLWDQIF